MVAVAPNPMGPADKVMLHSVHAPPDAAAVNTRFDPLIDCVTEKLPAIAEHLAEAREGLVACAAFPTDVWMQICPHGRCSRRRDRTATRCPAAETASTAAGGARAGQRHPGGSPPLRPAYESTARPPPVRDDAEQHDDQGRYVGAHEVFPIGTSLPAPCGGMRASPTAASCRRARATATPVRTA